MALFRAAIRKDSISLKVSPCPSFLVWDVAYLSLEISIELFFFPFWFSGYFRSVDVCVVCIVVSGCNQSSSVVFMYFSSFCIDASTLSWMLTSPHPPFLDTYSLSTTSLGYKALCIVISFLAEILLSSTLRMIPSVLWVGYLSLWWDFYVIWFRVVFSSSWVFSFNFFFHLHLFDGVRFEYSQVSLLFSELSDFFWI